MMGKALEESTKATNKNTQDIATIKSFEEKYAQSIEKSAASLQIIAESLPRSTVQKVGEIGGLFAVGAGLAGMLTKVGTSVAASPATASVLTRVVPGLAARIAARAAAGAAVGSVVPGIGTLIGAVGGLVTAVWAGNEIYQAVKTNTESTAENTANIPKPEFKPVEKQRDFGLLDALQGMVKSLSPQTDVSSKESVDAQKQSVELLSRINENLSFLRKDSPVQTKLVR